MIINTYTETVIESMKTIEEKFTSRVFFRKGEFILISEHYYYEIELYYSIMLQDFLAHVFTTHSIRISSFLFSRQLTYEADYRNWFI